MRRTASSGSGPLPPAVFSVAWPWPRSGFPFGREDPGKRKTRGAFPRVDQSSLARTPAGRR
jgi:hypothetical protein